MDEKTEGLELSFSDIFNIFEEIGLENYLLAGMRIWCGKKLQEVNEQLESMKQQAIQRSQLSRVNENDSAPPSFLENS